MMYFLFPRKDFQNLSPVAKREQSVHCLEMTDGQRNVNLVFFFVSFRTLSYFQWKAYLQLMKG